MPVLHQLQPSFNNGEISPLLYDRVDFQKFVSSVKSGKNMFVHPQGGMSNRAGTVMLAQAKDEVVRLIPFEFSSTETYVIEFGNGYCRFFTTNGQVVVEEGGVQVPYEIESPFSTEDLDKIRYCQSGDVMYLAWGGTPKTLTRYGHTQWAFSDYNYKNGPISLNNEYLGSLIKTEATEAYKYIGEAKALDGNAPYAFVAKDDLVWGRRNSLDDSINSITKCNGKLFGFQKLEGTAYYVYSTDGISWNRFPGSPSVTITGTGTGRLDVIYNGSVYLMWSPSGRTTYYRFTDFSSINSYEFPTEPYSVYSAVDYFRAINGKFFIGGWTSNSTYYSDDGITWVTLNTGGAYSKTGIPCYYYDGYYYGEGMINGYQCLLKWDSTLANAPTAQLVTNSHHGEGIVANNKLYYVASAFQQNNWLECYDMASGTVSTLYTFTSSGSGSTQGAEFKYYDNDPVFFIHKANSSYDSLKVKLSDNTVSLVPSPSGYYTVKIVPFDFPTSESLIELVSSDYTFSDKDVNRKFALLLNLEAKSIAIQQDNITTQISKYVFGGVFIALGSWSLYTSGTWSGKVVIETSIDGTTWQNYRSYASASGSANYSVSGVFDDLRFVRLSLQQFTGTIRVEFNVNSSEEYFYCYGRQVISDSVLSVEMEQSSALFLDYIINLSGKIYLSAWNEDTFPTDVEIYQDRIVWATNNELDATKISDYENFGVSTDVTDDDAISVIVKDKKVDKINSIVAGQKLAVYSDDGNFVHHNDTFTPNSATFLKQGATGGSEVKPVVVRDHIIYAHPMKQAISDYAYSFETDGYAGQDITLLANHLFDGKEIKTLAYQQEPYSIIWVLQEEGTVLACTYLRQQNVIAWTPMDFGGIVKSIAVCSHGTKEELYLAVQRANGTFVEKMPTRLLNSAPQECFFVDCGRTYRGEPATVISGLNYLEGEKVVALADGNVIKNLTVSNGSITLPIPASVVTVGLPYESVLETLTFDVNTGDGSHLNRKKRVVAVSIRYNNSRGSKVSVNGHKEIEMLRREQEGYNIPIALKSGVYRAILPSTHNESTHLKIKQDDPLPITIVSVIPEIEYEK